MQMRTIFFAVDLSILGQAPRLDIQKRTVVMSNKG